MVIFLAVDVGFYLYNPNRLALVLPFCRLNIIGGSTQVQTRDGLTWEKAEDGMVLEPGSRVRTAPDSQVALSFAQGTTTKLEPDTDVIVAKLEGNEDTEFDTVVLKQQAGKTWNQVTGRADGSDYFRIQTSAADIKVHGTLFAAEVGPSGETLVQTTEGSVSVSAQGQEVHVPAGQQITVATGAAPSAPASTPPAKDELIFTISEAATGLIIDPSGSSSGFIPGEPPLNQITGSRLSSDEEQNQVIRIPEPSAGEYTIVLYGVSDGQASIQVEGLAGGESTFSYSQSSNVTSVDARVVKLQLDAIDGLFREVAATVGVPTEGTEVASSPLSSPDGGGEKPAVLKKEAAPAKTAGGIGPNNHYSVGEWGIIAAIVFIVGGMLTIIWRRI